MKEKIVNLMKSEGLTSSRLAELLEIQPSRISHIVSGRNNPGFDLLQKILRRFPQINPDWLLLDSPTMYRDQRDQSGVDASGEAAPQGGGLPIDLFGGVQTNIGEVAQNSVGGSQGRNPQFSDAFSRQNLGGFSTENMGGISPQNHPQNHPSNNPQNHVQNYPHPMGENSPGNGPQNGRNFGTLEASVERIIVLYSDGSFRTYSMK
ncbi:MAG: helix-turn-helix transcriptional regulator [Rikenellaceae bacterium]